ncbi:MAG TPA: Crp/Fnr family transcriptional regulator [Cyclobacteriaceae bacterium]|nr:Crp/Fnr family transcriptional regulator [Cyclobacteriaceae bacterium]
MTALRNLFNSIHPLPEQFWSDLHEVIAEKLLPRKTILVKQGKPCNNTFFNLKGLARAYYYKNDTDVTSRFFRENELIIAVNNENIELTEDSALIIIPNDQLSHLQKTYPELNFVMRTIAEHNYILSEERSYDMRMKSARQRYEDLLQNDPQLFLRVPLKHIASYLGMKPETLSRIRSQR